MPTEKLSATPNKLKLASGKPSGTKTQGAVSGADMDRRVEKRTSPWKKWTLIGVGVALIIYMVIQVIESSTGRSLQVNESRMQISTVTSGVFHDFIPVRGRVTPAQTVFLDAIEGGRVEEILVEDGAMLKAGELIVKLSNAQLQLNVLSNEARVAEQLNNMRSIELSLEQNRLQHKRNLVDIDYQIKMLTRQEAREKQLVENGTFAKNQYEDTRDTLEWYRNRKVVTLESQQTDTRMQEEQLAFLKKTSARLEGNLEISRQNLENMNVRAPVDGKLSGFDVEIGQSIPRGERLGQIDTPNDFKLTANIDEYYLDRVDIGQRATFEDYELAISKIYPQVNNGKFEVDFKFVGQQPAGIRRGQSIQTRLTLGDDSKALLIPNGTFFQDTGGNWIFVVTADGQEALRRQITLGRRNSQFIEVLEGLEEGERVVTSPYTNFRDMDRLTLSQ
ncbi:efflux RND transporter periplasmic adaptor subunit [Aestuariibacter salexigens]|uniref:efflux RND transporter periplasmic adaptor subunit n=1 Tax=Aestuariibacter salexigens TaxID=226010 RepID=UPI0004223DAE|nr:efflux RND transporter periplasmic adaptor subunit [Aestuariibacter salexigens]